MIDSEMDKPPVRGTPSPAEVLEKKRWVKQEAKKGLEVLTSLAEGLAMCSDDSERVSLHQQIKLAVEHVLPEAHLTKPAPKGDELPVPLSHFVAFTDLPPLRSLATDPDSALTRVQVELTRLVQCGLLLLRLNLGGFDYFYLLLSRLEQVLVVRGSYHGANDVREFLDADGWRLIRELVQRTPPEYAGRLAHIVCLLLLRRLTRFDGALAASQKAPPNELFENLCALIVRAKQCDTFVIGALSACLLADQDYFDPLVQEGLLPYLVEYTRRLLSRPPPDCKLEWVAHEELERPSTLANLLVVFARLSDYAAIRAAEEAKWGLAAAGPFWHLPPQTPTSVSGAIRASGIANVMLEYLAKGGLPEVLALLQSRRKWINLFATGGPDPVVCNFPETPHCQAFSSAKECEKVQTFRFEIRVGGPAPVIDKEEKKDTEKGGENDESENPQEKKRRVEKGKTKEGHELETITGARDPARLAAASTIRLVAVPVNDPDAPEPDSLDGADLSGDESGEFFCPLCADARFASARALERHVDTCGLEEMQQSELPPVQLYTCPLCAVSFDDEGVASVHVATCGEAEPPRSSDSENTCPVCGEVFLMPDALKTHAANCGLPQSGRATEPGSSTSSGFAVGALTASALGGCTTQEECPVCEHEFSPGEELIAHIRGCERKFLSGAKINWAEGIRFQCEKCRKGFPSLKTLNDHLVTAHEFHCWKCSGRFDVPKGLDAAEACAAHERGCGKERVQRCAWCNREFWSEELLREHQCAALWKNLCVKCGFAGFNTTAARDAHVRDCNIFRDAAGGVLAEHAAKTAKNVEGGGLLDGSSGGVGKKEQEGETGGGGVGKKDREDETGGGKFQGLRQNAPQHQHTFQPRAVALKTSKGGEVQKTGGSSKSSQCAGFKMVIVDERMPQAGEVRLSEGGSISPSETDGGELTGGGLGGYKGESSAEGAASDAKLEELDNWDDTFVIGDFGSEMEDIPPCELTNEEVNVDMEEATGEGGPEAVTTTGGGESAPEDLEALSLDGEWVLLPEGSKEGV